MSDSGVLKTILHWLSRLTGRPESDFEQRDSQQLLDELARLHSARVLAEQLCVLTCAQLMVEHGVNERSIAAYFQSKEVRETPAGRFNFTTGIRDWAGIVSRNFVPLLRAGGYRPFLRALPPNDTAKCISSLCCGKTGAVAGLDPGQVADALYMRGLSPSVSMKIMATVRAMSAPTPEAKATLFQALAGLRAQVGTVEELAESADRTASDLEPPPQP